MAGEFPLWHRFSGNFAVTDADPDWEASHDG